MSKDMLLGGLGGPAQLFFKVEFGAKAKDWTATSIIQTWIILNTSIIQTLRLGACVMRIYVRVTDFESILYNLIHNSYSRAHKNSSMHTEMHKIT